MCNTGWDNTDASVVCRQLGFGAFGRNYGYYDNGLGPIVLSNVRCFINDYTLGACGHFGVGITFDCDHDDDVGVICDSMLYYNLEIN